MKQFRLVLGNQLFPQKHIGALGDGPIFMAEDVGLCTHYKYHKQKITLFLTAMRKYRDELISSGESVHYVAADNPLFECSFEEKLDSFLDENPKLDTVSVFEVEDKFFEKQLHSYFQKKGIAVITSESPMFLCSREGFEEYLEGVKKPFMKTFYEKQRKALNVLMDDGAPVGGQWSYDKDNRKKLPKDVIPPEFQGFVPDEVTLEVMDFVEMRFDDHPGSLDSFLWPTTRRESLQLLDLFVSERLENYGAYQDSITSRSEFVFHSLLSPAINMGLILPEEVIRSVEKAWRHSRGGLPLSSVEGFIRQVIGWREFVRGIYQNFSEKQWDTNFWENTRTPKPCWYSGTTGVPILDDSIQRAWKNGYSHHIERLMILSNMMLLCEWHPHQVYKWFMEMYCDSSDWVMGPNVFGMGQFSDGGIFATKPYICGSNYYLKMSDYPKGEWCDVVDGLYWRFVEKHKSFYSKNPRLSMMTRTLEKMDSARKKRIFAAAEGFLAQTMD